MNGNCFDMGTIQAFLDGETTPDMSLRLTTHVAACDTCALLLADAEEESSVVFSTLGRELDTLVPTQRLWSRINETIEVEKSQTSIWQKFVSAVAASFANPSIAAAAGVLLVMGMLAIMVSRQEPGVINNGDIAKEQQPAKEAPIGAADTKSSDEGSVIATTPAQIPTISRSNLSSREVAKMVVQANAKASQREIAPQYAMDQVPVSADGYLPGEESYVKTIADLKANVDTQKETVLTPSSRVSYERDMAVVNDSISRMREVVKRNPRNQAARQVLYSSYQDKIDLLNSVAQREELIASLR